MIFSIKYILAMVSKANRQVKKIKRGTRCLLDSSLKGGGEGRERDLPYWLVKVAKVANRLLLYACAKAITCTCQR